MICHAPKSSRQISPSQRKKPTSQSQGQTRFAVPWLQAKQVSCLMGFLVPAVGGRTLRRAGGDHPHALQVLHRSPSSWAPRGFPCSPALLAGSRQLRCQAAGMGTTSPRQDRKHISISYRRGCRLRHGELSGKTMAPSSLSSRSRQATLGNTEAQPVKPPQPCWPPPTCLGSASGVGGCFLLTAH